MPIYEYRCEKCGALTEVLQKMSDAAPACSKCGTPDIKRVMSQTSFVLKGSGWYMTDYGRAGKTDGESASGSASVPPTPAPKKAEGSGGGESSGSSTGGSTAP